MEVRVKFEELNQNLDAHLDEDDQQFDTRMRDGVVVVEGDIVRVTSEPIEGGNRLTFETMSGYSESIDVMNGEPGEPGDPGAPGHSPVITATKSGSVTTIYSDGAAIAEVDDGEDGEPGDPGDPGINGVTFTPAVSAQGVISWTNDGGLPNPQSQDIKGVKGDPGPNEVTGKTATDIDGVLYGYKGEISGIEIDDKPTDSSNNLITSGAVASAIEGVEVYWATYGTTTYAELTAAWNESKQILCYWSNRVYRLIYKGTSFTFGYDWGSTNYRLSCDSSSNWSNTSDSMYSLPSGGIPKTDLASGVKNSLDAADAALPATGTAKKSAGVLVGEFEDSSTSGAYVATVSGVTELYHGLTVFLKGIPVRAKSSSPWTLDVNGLGAKDLTIAGGGASSTSIYTAMSAGNEYLYIYDADGDSGNGQWLCVVGANTNDNTIAIYIRAGVASHIPPAKNAIYRYMIGGINRDDQLVPFCDTSNKPSTNTKVMTTDAFDPRRPFWYYSSTGTVSAGGKVSVSYYNEAYTGSMYYSYAFNIYSAQNLTADLPIYLVCVPQADGQVKLHSSPIAQALPASKDNLVYIYLGRAVDGTHGTIDYLHPCYYHNGVSVVPWHDEVIV